MNLFTVDHSPNGGLNPCRCEKQSRHSDYVARNQVNLDTLTEVTWEDGMWIVHFGDIYYRVHAKDKMAKLEAALDLKKPT